MKRLIRTLSLLLCLCLCLGSTALAYTTKLAALTFDDGPNNEITPQILDTLREKGAKATFFCVGRYLIDKGPVLNRTVAEGHQIGSHTFDHVNLAALTEEQLQDQLCRLEEKLREMTGRSDAKYWLRPPYGAYDQQSLAWCDVPVIHWSVDAAQGRTVPGDQMAVYIIKHTVDGAVILMHDTTQENANAIPLAIDALQAQGYEFVTVAELFRLKGVTPQNGTVYRRIAGSDPLAFDEGALSTHWAHPYIRFATQQGLISGDATGFRPNHPLTRSMAVTVLWRMAGRPHSSHSPGFRDVPYGSWSHTATAWAVSSGLITGREPGVFGADLPVSREEFYSMVAKLARLTQRAQDTTAPEVPAFQDDRRIHAWARDDIAYLRMLGFVSDYDRELFRPLDDMTRAEAAELATWFVTD